MNTEALPVEPAEVTMARIDAHADLAMAPACLTRDPDVEVTAMDPGGIPRAFGIRHRVDCIDFAPDWP